jgi:hypothetical protein
MDISVSAGLVLGVVGLVFAFWSIFRTVSSIKVGGLEIVYSGSTTVDATERQEAQYVDQARRRARELVNVRAALSRSFRLLRLIQVLIGASIPIVALAIEGAQIPTAILGGFIVVLGGIESTWSFQDRAVAAGFAAAELNREISLFSTSAGQYSEVEATLAFRRFVERSEEIISDWEGVSVSSIKRPQVDPSQ